MIVEPPDCWQDDTSVLFTSFWGWSPETWGTTIGWSGERGLTRRANVLDQLNDPFITVCYVTSNKTYIDPELKGKIAGYYLVSHQTGDRDEFTHPTEHASNPEKWQHSLRALCAFSYLPEHRLSVTDLDPDMLARARSISAMGEVLTDTAVIERLRTTPWEEVEVYHSATVQAEPENEVLRGSVPAGPASRGGYAVSGGAHSTPRELYILRLVGDVAAYLGRPAVNQAIIKIGLSASPDLRRQNIQKAMPRGAFSWKVDRSARSCGLPLCANHSVAVKGGDAMKRHLAANAEWLGGEFYLATENDIETAWQSGCQAVEENF